jgi:uncharacterized protein (TIGR03435 family)
MKKINVLFLLIFLFGNMYSQDTLKIGDKAPKINITDYILNIPKDKNIEGKFIVLEFWATWCAPCLSAVPHLNELHDNFKNRKDLLFLSMTYEKPEKTKRTLEKIPFKTVVVSDQTKLNEANFNVDEIPHTVLIDNKGVIRWIGIPTELNSSIIENLLNGTNISKGNLNIATEKKQEKVTEEQEPANSIDITLELLKDNKAYYVFSVINAAENEDVMAFEALWKGKYIDLNNNLKSMISKIIKKPEYQIIIPNELVENKYNIFYKNSNKIEINEHIKLLKNNLLTSLNLTEKVEIKKVEVYNLKVENAEKLNFSPNEEEKQRHNGSNTTHFIFSNSNIETLIRDVGNYHKIIIFNETEQDKNLDFIIRKGNLTELINDLKEYGLRLEKVSKEIEFYSYQ